MPAANTDKFIKLARKWVGQIGSGGVSDASVTTVPLASATNLPTDTAAVVVIDRVDSNGTKTPNLEETVIGVVSGSNLTSCVRGVEGTAQAHLAGAVVEVLFTAAAHNKLVDGLLVAHNQDGTHKSGSVFTLPQINDTSSDHQYVVSVCELAADRTVALPLLASDDEFVFKAHTQTLSNKKHTGDFELVGATDNIKVNSADPKRGIYIPASAFFPATTTGCAALAQGETSSNKINYKYLAFDQSTEEYAWVAIPTPDYWDLSTVTVKFHWTAASGSGNVIWGAAGLCRSDDDALDTALGTAQTVTDTLLSTGDQHTTSATSAITIGGTPAKGDFLYLRVYRDADAGGDTHSADAHLLGITVKFGIGQYDDQ